MTCWRRMRDWQAAGVWAQLHRVLLVELREADAIDWSRAVVDSASLRALAGGPKTGPNPTDRAKAGSKHHVITDARGIPLAAILTAANVNDIEELLPLVDHSAATSQHANRQAAAKGAPYFWEIWRRPGTTAGILSERG